ncbi:mRNA decapping complex subunit [Lachnellula subtilissima]|uniref:mRNA decapping complex subunit n=1 Tax=Lachnellula subtilissima TaxID=602034 RepID=A0A8H8UCU9_9HELO|nr:mRNA decapping complex subunit [Lachnellula subtilissima]
MTERNLKLEEWLDDLCVRFIINLPEDDLKDIPRICFQVEEAQWYYEDFIRPLDPSLPSMSLRNFCLRIFAHCPLLSSFSQGHHMRAFEDFLAYKTRVPVRGAMMLNASMDSVVLVKGWKKGASWSFPRGKIAKDEDDLTCAIREVYEETGFDLDAAGLVPLNRDVKSIQVNMREQQMRLFVFRNVPMETHFEPRTRKEISKIEWWLLSELPAFRKKSQQQQQQKQAVPNSSKFYMVAPFLVPLRKWVIEQKKKDAQRPTSNQYLSANMSYDEFLTEEDQGAESATQMPSYKKPSAPELDTDTLEGATAALSRLLKIQPATQGLQADVATQSPSKNSGEALLALLKPVGSNQSLPANAPPHTPLENIVMQPAMPKTPHHQQPRPPHFSNIPPPPDFPIQSRDDSFSHREGNYQNNRHNVAGFQQGHVGRQNPPRPQGNPHSYQSQHLIHPQPLPPHVQRALFTGGAVHSPMVSQSIQQKPPPVHMTVSGPTGAPQFPGPHATMGPQTIQQTPKLTSHSLALLNAFKTRDQAADEVSGSNDLPLQRYTAAPNQASIPAPRAVPQELPAEGLQPGQMPPPPQIKVQQNVGPLTPTPLAPRQSISATQKSTLLDLFKSPTSQPASLANLTSATSLPISTTPSVVELSAVEPLSTGASTTSALLNSKRTPDNLASNGAVPVLNPESNLPFRAVSILGRPPNMSDKQSLAAAGSELDSKPKSNGKKPMARMNTGPHTVKSPEKPFQPQILKRPQQSSSRAQQSPPAVQPAASALASQQSAYRLQQSPTAVSPSNFQSSQGSLRMPHSATTIQHPVSTFVPPPDRRPSQAVEHKQNLLSMFGKAQAGPISPPGRDGPSIEPLASTVKASARSRVGSLASGGDGTSRRGSQTPISPADKGFLLGYLEAVAKGSR